jgi:hypothetical protein
MCNADTATLIAEVVDEKIDNDELFTAFDVSLVVKKRAADKGFQVERHRHMRREIHNCMSRHVNGGTYESTTWNVGAPSPAILYFPTGGDPNEYEPQKRDDQKSKKSKSNGQATQAYGPGAQQDGLFDADDDDDDDNGNGSGAVKGRKPDSRGTLAIPNSFIRGAGYHHGDRVYVASDNENGEQVLVVSDDKAGALVSYVVDHGDNVRITASILTKGGITCSSGYKFDLKDSNKVLVKSTD